MFGGGQAHIVIGSQPGVNNAAAQCGHILEKKSTQQVT